MRVPSSRYWYRHIRFIIVFIFGMIIGASVFLVLLGGQLDMLHLKIRKLESENVHYVEENILLKDLEKKMVQKQKTVVKEIKLHITAPNGFIEAEIEKKMARDLIFLKGRPVEYVADFHAGLIMIITDRKYKIENQTYVVRPKILIIAPALQLYVNVEKDK
ncbi:hypothetical protein [Aneurinibacillus tyrosinisolvens]|uniref:hypothetical protein n=1 Tax=Aneurinibacillus tyrosinisolvens TaxID=1443435 RepID=UPI00063FC569|nr:hypothetical protein [Aneurinibacillus tyrosinisolvens]